MKQLVILSPYCAAQQHSRARQADKAHCKRLQMESNSGLFRARPGSVVFSLMTITAHTIQNPASGHEYREQTRAKQRLPPTPWIGSKIMTAAFDCSIGKRENDYSGFNLVFDDKET
ncbi:MAG: hypothetical protein KGQ42_05820 [Alphaproteobacteria bacterium]|nr:hypothetical protein [Alphaproteobacteria bacterium]